MNQEARILDARLKFVARRRLNAIQNHRDFLELREHHAADIQKLIADNFLAGDMGTARVIVLLAFRYAQQNIGRFDRAYQMLPWLKMVAIDKAIDFQRACA